MPSRFESDAYRGGALEQPKPRAAVSKELGVDESGHPPAFADPTLFVNDGRANHQ